MYIPTCDMTNRQIYVYAKDFNSPSIRDRDEYVLATVIGYYYDTVVFEVEDEKNENSQYGYFYMKQDIFNEKYSEGEAEMDKSFKYELYYVEGNRVKSLYTNSNDYKIDDQVVINDNNAYKIVAVEHVDELEEEVKGSANPYIVCKVVDEIGNKRLELKEIRAKINKITAEVNKYMLVILTEEKLPDELVAYKGELIDLLKREKELKEELEKLY